MFFSVCLCGGWGSNQSIYIRSLITYSHVFLYTSLFLPPIQPARNHIGSSGHVSFLFPPAAADSPSFSSLPPYPPSSLPPSSLPPYALRASSPLSAYTPPYADYAPSHSAPSFSLLNSHSRPITSSTVATPFQSYTAGGSPHHHNHHTAGGSPHHHNHHTAGGSPHHHNHHHHHPSKGLTHVGADPYAAASYASELSLSALNALLSAPPAPPPAVAPATQPMSDLVLLKKDDLDALISSKACVAVGWSWWQETTRTFLRRKLK
jgi:hypothetical protein